MVQQELPVLLSIAFFGPVQYFSRIVSSSRIIMEANENYTKQSYRNRCIILTANGPFSLSIPVKYRNHPKTAIRDVRIDYDTPWNRIHKQAILSAYRNSPFMEYYQDDILPFFSGKHSFLFDYNLEILQTLLRIMHLDRELEFTREWDPDPATVKDYRNIIHPKKDDSLLDPEFQPISYVQVFESRFGFVPNLSILDLLFCEGPNASEILKNQYKK